MKKEIKQKKTVTSDVLIMFFLIGAAVIVLVGFVAYNFGHSAGEADRVKKAEDEINKELIQMADDQQKMEKKYSSVFDITVAAGEEHESEDEFDLTVYKKDYPLLNYGYTSGNQWQLVINLDQSNPKGTSLVCADTEAINEYCEQLYTYIAPPKNKVDTDNAIYVFRDGQIYDLIYCERLYFTSAEFRSCFEEVPTADLGKYFN